MMARRGDPTGLCGILPIDKPAGLTSHDVVAHVRRVSGERRVGHGGTLDPTATGLLVVMIGPATRLGRFFLEGDKTYEARVSFGMETDTCDADGISTREALVPDEVFDPGQAAVFVSSLVGEIEQVPPAYSAIKIGGRKAYDLARSGQTPDIPSRRISILRASLLGISDDPRPSWDIELTVSKGTYIRALARDIGMALDSAAHLTSLRRTASGRIDLTSALTLSELDVLIAQEGISAAFQSAAAVLGFPEVRIDEPSAKAVSHGRTFDTNVTSPQATEGSFVSLTMEDRLMAVYVRDGDVLSPEVVLPGGCV